MRIAAHCAQVLAGVKPSNSVTLGREDTTVFIQALTGTGIQRRLIYDGVKRCVWLLYRENELEHYLMIREHQEFMKSCGYNSVRLSDTFSVLCKISGSIRMEKGFPWTCWFLDTLCAMWKDSSGIRDAAVCFQATGRFMEMQKIPGNYLKYTIL